MICEICNKRQAVKEIQVLKNGSTQVLAVCAECFNQGKTVRVASSKKCRFCGREWEQISHTLIVGCEHCYSQFAKELDGIIRKVQQL